MDYLHKKGINFDLDTVALKEHYPKDNWNNAYYELRSFFEAHGFEHIQGSGYHSVKPMSEMDAMSVIYRMARKCPIRKVPKGAFYFMRVVMIWEIKR